MLPVFVWWSTENEWNANIAVATFYQWYSDCLDDHALYDLLILRNDNGDGNENFKSN